MKYDIAMHRHRFSVWAAARAAQRGWKSASVEVLRDAVESCGVIEFISKNELEEIDDNRFLTLHRTWCHSIVGHLTGRVPDPKFGRAAKLLAVYLKSTVILGPYGDSDLARVAHPPIDRILIQKISRDRDVCSLHKQAWRKENWTQMDEQRYYVLIRQLRAVCPPPTPFWNLQRFWTVTE